MEKNEFVQRGKETEGTEMTWAVKAGITDGTCPEAFVSREETVQMLYRALEYFFRQMIAVLGGEESK